MKKRLALGTLFLLSLASCKKDYTCVCYDYSGDAVLNSQIKARNASKALDECRVDYNSAIHSSCGVSE